MVLHKNNRFIYNNTVAVRIPNNLCMDYSFEVLREEAIELIAPDESFHLVIEFQTTPRNARTFTKEIYEEHDRITAIDPVRPIEALCGVSGYTTTYDLVTEILEEFAFDIPSEPHVLLNIWMSRAKGTPYDTELYAKAKRDVLESIEII